MPTGTSTGRPRLFERLASVAVAVAAALTLSSCGGGDDDKAETAPKADNAAAATGVFPVTVEHKYGGTEVKEAPKKIVTLGLSDHDTVLALGAKPVGSIEWFKEKPYGKWPWTKDLWGATTPQIVGERDEYNMEKILELDPDLIIAVYSGMKQEQYDTLSKIAPVVAQPKGHDDYAAPWQVMTRQIGKALGKTAETDALIGGIEARFKTVREQHPEFASQTLIVADSFEAGKYAAFTKTDPKAIFFQEMGFKLAPRIDENAQPGANVAEFSSEKLDLLDSDRLVWVTSSTSANDRIKAEPLYAKLKVAQEKRDLFIPYENPDIGAAFSFNTVLSIPYAIDQVVPLLTAKG
ncbi:iron-siderophore ABC transporter substrate-binding protein [Yinghuangia sp. YIM S09857]|uniref:iron-siderophore ABC transporter substrate-binding protein n=1 Tax=Yinghuangia sp. YIM S09857 TaxID=3436929 RepID=UPI003F538F24